MSVDHREVVGFWNRRKVSVVDGPGCCNRKNWELFSNFRCWRINWEFFGNFRRWRINRKFYSYSRSCGIGKFDGNFRSWVEGKLFWKFRRCDRRRRCICGRSSAAGFFSRFSSSARNLANIQIWLLFGLLYRNSFASSFCKFRLTYWKKQFQFK